jgi:nucleoside recognition membrane protein YjiH
MLLIGVYIPFFQNILKTVPLNFFDWLLLVVLGFLEITLVELGKMIFIRKNSKLTATNAKN